MATTQVNPVEDEAPKRSALDTFAQAMGILTSLGSLGVQGYNTKLGIENAKASKDLMDAQTNWLLGHAGNPQSGF